MTATRSQFFKITREGALVVCRLSAIAAQDLGAKWTRPWVHVHGAHEALELALMCYEGGMVPLITERDPAGAAELAGRWQADLIITDEQSLRAIAPHLSALESLREVMIMGSADNPELQALVPGRTVHFIPS